jgi:hypothetical protein
MAPKMLPRVFMGRLNCMDGHTSKKIIELDLCTATAKPQKAALLHGNSFPLPSYVDFRLGEDLRIGKKNAHCAQTVRYPSLVVSSQPTSTNGVVRERSGAW